jgi:Na+/H+-dicarboxylate symporter
MKLFRIAYNMISRLTFSTQVLIGFVLGILCGIFFGEYCQFLQIVGNAFIKLLQITILPYITVSLILGIGGLNYEQAKILAIKAGKLLLLFWGILFAIVLLLPVSFPEWESAAFFSTSIFEPPKEVDFLELYIPSNPYNAMANALVPAVVLFCILFGIALIGMKDKQILLQALSTTAQSLIKVTGFIVKLTPIGIFAITAASAGTMTIEEFGRLQVYLVSFNIAALFLTFWVLPRLVAAVTPFKYRDIVLISRDALVTAFTTGNLFVVLAVLTTNCKNLFEAYDLKKQNTDAYVDVIIPVSFNFPNMGKLLMLLFILFAAWYSGDPLSLAQMPTFMFTGLLSFFAGVDIAIPFMLDFMRIPTDLYQLYLVTGVLNGRTSTLLAAMNLLVFTLLAAGSITGVVSYSKKRLLGFVMLTAMLTVCLIAGTRGYLSLAVKNVYDRDMVIASMQSGLLFSAPMVVHTTRPEGLKPRDSGVPVLQQIYETGVLRVGYNPGNLPFTYFNAKGNLVGFDVDMAQLLANELKCKIEFVPFDWNRMAEDLERGYFDIIMSGIIVTTDRLKKMTFSEPYMETTFCFIVRDHRRRDFSSWDAVRNIPKLKIGLLRRTAGYFLSKMSSLMPNAEVIEIESLGEFFDKSIAGLDAVVLDAERGSAWSLVYPQYLPVVPLPNVTKTTIAYPIAGRDRATADFMSQWIRLKKNGFEYQTIYDHWILGLSADPKKPRWSMIRNVLHWAD